MKRREAIACLKKMQKTCFNMSPIAVALVKSKQNDSLSIGYQIHIHAVLDQPTKTQIRTIIAKQRYEISEAEGKIVIYKPKEVLASI